MKSSHAFLLMLIVTGITACSVPRNQETDKLGWTDKNKGREPSLQDHTRTPGRVPYQPGEQPVTQPDYPQGEMKSLKSNPNNFPTPPLTNAGS